MNDPTAGPRSAASGQALEEVLERVTRSLHATRVLLWEAGDDGLVPLGRPVPLPRMQPGDRLPEALRTDSPVRVEPPPRWAQGSVVAVRLDDSRFLTIESAADLGLEEAAEAARTLAPILRLHDEHMAAVAAADRADKLVAFLRSMNATATTGRLPDTLLDTALAVGRASGGVVASWIGHEGTVLAAAGQEGGPLPGKTFAMGEGDLARAAETGSTVSRDPDTEAWPALAWSGERWESPGPAYRTVLPLIEPGGMTTGMLALWGTDPLADPGVALLEALAPLLATQLRTASELDRLRARATIDTLTGLPNRRALLDRLAEEQARFDRYHRPVALLVVELQDLDRITDSLGPAAGEAILRSVASAIRAAIREVDFAARYDHARLAVLLPETPLAPAMDVAERVRAAAATPVEHADHTAPAVAVGVSACPESAPRPNQLLESAEAEL